MDCQHHYHPPTTVIRVAIRYVECGKALKLRHGKTTMAIGNENERQKLTTVDSRTMNAFFMLCDPLAGGGDGGN